MSHGADKSASNERVLPSLCVESQPPNYSINPSLVQNAGERAAQTKLVDHILRRNADDILDVGRAIGKFEAEAREERHRLKNKGANKKGRGPKGAAGGVAKKGAAPRKGKGGAKGGAKGGPAGNGGKRK